MLILGNWFLSSMLLLKIETIIVECYYANPGKLVLSSLFTLMAKTMSPSFCSASYVLISLFS